MASPPGPEHASEASRHSPRWWRRMLVAARRGNIYLWLEILAATSLAVMLATSYLAVSRADPSRLIPAAQAAAMLVGTLIPALSLLVLFGRRLAIRRAGGTTARLHVNLVFFFSLVAAIPTLLVAVFASVL
ncbi:MAG TPA: PAS domain-containing sensor histidine kinase, partial [Croceibacterium sp.]|nr:PAS domain-containing sensor histidine kinase [Croceibacterium sp.]